MHGLYDLIGHLNGGVSVLSVSYWHSRIASIDGMCRELFDFKLFVSRMPFFGQECRKAFEVMSVGE